MKVVANGTVLNKIKLLDIFKLDLGVSIIDQKSGDVEMKDPFIFKYFSLFGKQIMKYGNIGKLGFYQDFTLSQRDYVIFNDEKMYNVVYDKDEEKLRIDEHLSNIIQEIEDIEGVDVVSDDEIKQTRKNPDLTLPKEQYLQEMIKKRNKK